MIKVVFMGTPKIAVNSLKKLLNFNDLQIQAVVTQPDRPAGRGNLLTPPPIKECALKNAVPVLQTESIKNDRELIQKLKDFEPDFFITFAFGQILTQEVLDIPKFATINLHASLLPEYRGANPIQRAIYDGKKETGITTMLTVLALDAGDICAQEKIQIPEDMTDIELSEIISDKAPFLLYKTIKGLYTKTLIPQKQDESRVSIAKKFQKQDGEIDWTRNAEDIHNQVRAMRSWPTAYTKRSGKIIKILETKIVDRTESSEKICSVKQITKDGMVLNLRGGSLLVTKIKPEGKQEMNPYDWANGAKIKAGDIFADGVNECTQEV